MTTGTGWCFGGPQIAGDDAGLFATVSPADDPATRPARQAEAGRFAEKAPTHSAPVAVAPDGRQVMLDAKDISTGREPFAELPDGAGGPFPAAWQRRGGRSNGPRPGAKVR